MTRSLLHLASLWLVILVHLAASGAIPFLVAEGPELRLRLLPLFFAGSLVISQPTLLGAWAGLSCRPWRLRIPIACGLATASFLLMVTAQAFCNRPLDVAEVIIFAGIAITAMGAAFVACNSLRKRFNWQIVYKGQLPRPETARDRQFRVSDLLLWTAGIGIAFGWGRAIVGPVPASFEPLNPLMLVLLAVSVMLFAVHGLTLLAALLDPVDRNDWLKATLAFLFLIILFQLVILVFGEPPFLIGIEFALLLGVGLSTAPLALTGWRLERVDSRLLDLRQALHEVLPRP